MGFVGVVYYVLGECGYFGSVENGCIVVRSWFVLV